MHLSCKSSQKFTVLLEFLTPHLFCCCWCFSNERRHHNMDILRWKFLQSATQQGHWKKKKEETMSHMSWVLFRHRCTLTERAPSPQICNFLQMHLFGCVCLYLLRPFSVWAANSFCQVPSPTNHAAAGLQSESDNLSTVCMSKQLIHQNPHLTGGGRDGEHGDSV